MSLEDINKKLEECKELLKSNPESLFETEEVKDVKSSADMDRSKKMRDAKHMNGKNSEAFNYKGEKIMHERVPSDVAVLKEEGPDMASPEDSKKEGKELKGKRKPVTHDECSRPFAKDDLNDKIKAKLKQEMDRRNFGEADATRHVIDRDRGDKMAEKPKEKPLLQTEMVKFDSNGQWSIEKSNYGPKGYGLYNQTDNAQRKAKNTGDSFDNVGQNKNAKKYTTSGSSMSAAHEASQAKEQRKKTKQSTRTFADMSPEEKAKMIEQYSK